MTKRELERYRKKLEERLKPDSKVLTQSVGGRTADDTEMASNALEQFVESKHNRMDTEIRRLVREAIARLDDGTYGTCLECDGSIPRLRLNAVPWARYCVTCQEKLGTQNSEDHDSDRGGVEHIPIEEPAYRKRGTGGHLRKTPQLAAKRQA